MPGFRPDNAAIVIETLLKDRRRGDPKFCDFDAIIVLILGGMFEPEEISKPFTVVSIDMGNANGVEIIAAGFF